MARIYIGCSLTQASEGFVRKVESLKAHLRAEGHEVADFLGLVAGTPVDVYETDIHKRVAECEVLVAICDLPSIGLGWEIGTAVEKYHKPVLAVAHKDAKISRLPIGADCERNPNYWFRRYENLNSVARLVSEFLKEISAKAI